MFHQKSRSLLYFLSLCIPLLGLNLVARAEHSPSSKCAAAYTRFLRPPELKALQDGRTDLSLEEELRWISLFQVTGNVRFLEPVFARNFSTLKYWVRSAVHISHSESLQRALRDPHWIFSIASIAFTRHISQIHNFDPERGFRFITYFKHSLRRMIRRMVIEELQGPFLAPYTALHGKILREHQRLTRENNGEPPSITELAEHMGVLSRSVEEALDNQAARRASVASLDTSLRPHSNEEDSSSLYEVIPSSHALSEDDLLDALSPRNSQEALLHATLEGSSDILTHRETQALQLLFGKDLNVHQAAQEMGVSHQRVSTLRNSAIERLRRHFSENAP